MTKQTSTVDQLLGTFQKDYGDKVGGFGLKVQDATRIPTGLFAFDLATGGGLPRGKCSIIYGPESSGKTSIALKAIAVHQKLWPDLRCVFFDVENSFDVPWAQKIGVDTDALLVLKPDYAEQIVNMVEGLLYAQDCGLVVIDSIAAMMTVFESEADAEKAVPGGAGLACAKLAKKSTLALSGAAKEGHMPTLLYINQVRSSMAMMGDPETMPGGKSIRFQSALTVRVFGKNVSDTKVSKVLPIRKEIRFVVKKWKVPLVAASGKVEMVTIPHNGFEVGDTNDWNTLSTYLEKLGHLEKQKNGYRLFDQVYSRLKDVRETLDANATWQVQVKAQVISELVDSGDGSPEELADD